MATHSVRRIGFIAIIAALYAMLTIAIAPLSYGPVQFRVSEALKALVLVQPWAIPGIVVGTFTANLFSPYVGLGELVWMPLTDGLGGLVAWWVGRRWPWLGLALYALTTAGAVALMLQVVAGLPLLLTAAEVLAGEAVCIPLGWPIARRLREWGLLR